MYKMLKYYFIYLIAFLAVLLLLMLSLGCTCAMGAVPYSSATRYASYEGFSGLNPANLDDNKPQFAGSYSMDTNENLLDSIQKQITALAAPDTTTTPTAANAVAYTPTSPTTGSVYSLTAPPVSEVPTVMASVPAAASAVSPTKKVEGFSLSDASNFASSDASIDHYSQLPGSLTCDGYGYFNSLGNLCMDSTGSQMLKTRGGNQTGASSQIGF